MANIFEVTKTGNDLLEKADQVRLASIKISQTQNQNRIKALNCMADYLEKNTKKILEEFPNSKIHSISELTDTDINEEIFKSNITKEK